MRHLVYIRDSAVVSGICHVVFAVNWICPVVVYDSSSIIISMDKGEVTALTLLHDLSAAFDTMDHATLTYRLSGWYGISGQAQIWFSSFFAK